MIYLYSLVQDKIIVVLTKDDFMKVMVVPYSPDWSRQFIKEKQLLTAVLDGQVIAIDHIGSTSIPGIYAKPTIDILIAVKDIRVVDEFNPAMQELGYEAKGEFGIPERRFFMKNIDEQRTHNVHIFQIGNSQLARHISFRDYLIVHPIDADKYSELKIKLAKKFADDRDAYQNGKDEFIKAIDAKALQWRQAR